MWRPDTAQGTQMTTTRTVPAADLHIGDLVVPARGPARRVTLHRLQGTPPTAVIGYADTTSQTTIPATQPITIATESPPG
jgi:hypothetical protein